jgi:hypothetical protein
MATEENRARALFMQANAQAYYERSRELMFEGAARACAFSHQLSAARHAERARLVLGIFEVAAAPERVVIRVVQVTEMPAAHVAKLVATADALRDLTLQPDFSKTTGSAA